MLHQPAQQPGEAAHKKQGRFIVFGGSGAGAAGMMRSADTWGSGGLSNKEYVVY